MHRGPALDDPPGLAGPRPVIAPARDPEAARESAARRAAGPTTKGSRPSDRTGLSTIPEAIAAIRRGELVLVVDDHDRENEGDLVMAAAHVTTAAVNFMVTHGRGLVCLSLSSERCDELELGPMVPQNAGQEETAFTVSIDLDVAGSTGISAHDRARTIRRAVDPAARPADFRRPGHVFPLRARREGVLARRGHTEASVDLARLAGREPAGVICEVMNPDGTMARLPQLLEMAADHDLHLVTIADLVAYRRRHELLVERITETVLPTPHGDARAVGYRAADGREHIALCFGDLADVDAPLARVHSECLTGDVFSSHRCDCGEQLDEAMARMAAEAGVLVYTRGHEGRGIGLVNKLRAYALQDAGHDTVEANLALGHGVDERDFLPAAHILRDLGIDEVHLLTNNPAKSGALEDLGVRVRDRVPLRVTPRPQNVAYLRTKQAKLGHDLDVGPGRATSTTDRYEGTA